MPDLVWCKRLMVAWTATSGRKPASFHPDVAVQATINRLQPTTLNSFSDKQNPFYKSVKSRFRQKKDKTCCGFVLCSIE